MSDSAAEITQTLRDWLEAVQAAGCPAPSLLRPGLEEQEIREALEPEGIFVTETILAAFSLQNGYPDGTMRNATRLAVIGIAGLSLEMAIDGYRRFIGQPVAPDVEFWPGWFPVLYSSNGYVLNYTVPDGDYPIDAVRIYGDGDVLDVCPSLREMVGWWTDFTRSGRWYWVTDKQSWDSTMTFGDLTPQQQNCQLSY